MEEERDNAVGAREMDVSPLIRRGKVLDGKVCATLSWSSSPTKGGDDGDDDEMEDEQQYPPTSPLPKRPRSAAPSPYSSTCEGGSEGESEGESEWGFDGRTRADLYTDDEMNDVSVESNFERESPDIYMGKLTLHTASSSLAPFTGVTAGEDSEEENSDPDDDCDTICDTGSDTEMDAEPQVDYNHQGQDDTEDGCTEYEGDDDGGRFFTFERRQPDLGNRATLAALTGGPRKALWYPTEPLAQENHILSEDWSPTAEH